MPILKIGNSGPEVKKVQEFLFNKNYYKEFLPLSKNTPSYCITGTYNEDTAEAVSLWQARHSTLNNEPLEANGEVDSATYEAMFGVEPTDKKTSVFLVLGSTGPNVKKVQEFLFKKNYFKEFLPLHENTEAFCITGKYTAETVMAVELWQARHRTVAGEDILSDGEVGPITWEAMFGSTPAPSKPYGNTKPSPAPKPTPKPAPVTAAKKIGKLAALALQIAKREVGTMEDPPGSNWGARVKLFLITAGYKNPEPWCAAFVYWCYVQAAKELGVENPLPKTGYCPTLYNGIKIKIKSSNEEPQAGDIFFVQGATRLNHVGFVSGNKGDGYVSTIEGNTSGGGSREGVGVFARRRSIKGLVFARIAA